MQLDEKFILKINGREFVKYEGLLTAAHEKGIERLEVTPIQYPTEENGNEAICKAVLTSKGGEVFADIGDANPKNAGKLVSAHILRMASTRAKARCLRDFTNVGLTALEELGEMNEEDKGNGNGNGRQTFKQRKPQTSQGTSNVKPIKPATSAPKPSESTSTGSNAEGKPEAQGANNAPPVTITDTSKPKGNGNGKGAKTANGSNGSSTISQAQKAAVINLAKRRGISFEELAMLAQTQYGIDDLDSMASKDASSFIRYLQTAA